MRAALLVMAALALLPAAARAQVQPARHDSTQAQIEMMQSMMEGTLRVLAKPETADQLATFTRNYYDALIRKGFTKAEALEIVTKIGVPMPGLTRCGGRRPSGTPPPGG